MQEISSSRYAGIIETDGALIAGVRYSTEREFLCRQRANGQGNEARHARFPLLNPPPTPSSQSSPASGRGGEWERQSSIPAGGETIESLREFFVTQSAWPDE